MAERSKALVSGTSIFGCVGSNPTLCNQYFAIEHQNSVLIQTFFLAAAWQRKTQALTFFFDGKEGVISFFFYNVFNNILRNMFM